MPTKTDGKVGIDLCKFICVLGLILAGLIVFFAFILSLPKYVDIRYSVGVIITFVVNGIMFLIGFMLSVKRYKYSFEMIFWIFNFFFFFMAPLIQYLKFSFPWEYSFSNRLLIKTNIIIAIYTVIFCLIYNLTIYKIKTNKYQRVVIINKNVVKNSDTKYENNALKVLSCLTMLYVVMFIVRTNKITDLFSKYTVGEVWNITSSQSFNNLFSSCSAYFVGIVFLFNIRKFCQERKINVGLICSLISFCCVCFPLSLTRYVVAILYISLLIYVFEKRKISGLFPSMLIIALVLIFPIMGSLSHFNVNENDFISLIIDVIKNIKDTYLSADYDAYVNFAKAIKYVETNTITWGWQLIGCLLFFIPRSLWPGKPVGSGAFVANKMGMTFTNISMPLAGEGYINFGFFGTCGFGAIIAYVSAKLDYEYWNKNNNYIIGLYPLTMILLFFMYRGDLMSSYSSLVYIIVVYTIVYEIIYRDIIKKMISRGENESSFC